MNNLSDIRSRIRKLNQLDEQEILQNLIESAGFSTHIRQKIHTRAVDLIQAIRSDSKPGLMEVFLAEYGLSTDEGIALMCLAEALLRVPDAHTIDQLIEDKIAASSWGEHLGKSSSSLVNASTWGLMLTGKILQDDGANRVEAVLRNAVKRVGEPVIRVAVKRAMVELGHQFVLGETIEKAVKRGKAKQKAGYTYSYDMLGEAALTAHDADGYFNSYSASIKALSEISTNADIRENPGISIKLSALHPRYEVSQKQRVMDELVPRVKQLALMAKHGRMGLNIDAEEADRLDLSLDVIEAVLRSDELSGWDGFGVVVQAYNKRATGVIDWLYALSTELNRKIMVRLVKGAYWDTEIKQAQVDGVEHFPVFTQKSATDVSYMCSAQKLLTMTDRIYPQFATHNAHSVSAILELASDKQAFEFQRLHGMGEGLYNILVDREAIRCRIYAPVGTHKDLLAYLVRRLLENGANSSFVNQIIDTSVDAETIAADPLSSIDEPMVSTIKNPQDLFLPERMNSTGWDLRDFDDLAHFEKCREPFKTHQWHVKPLIAAELEVSEKHQKHNPAEFDDLLGTVQKATHLDVVSAIDSAKNWETCAAKTRSEILLKAADLFEQNSGEIFAALCREAGKSALDAVAEIREAVDFLRFYAMQAIALDDKQARGLITCISPWNFPLAIFTGQIAAALAAGNGVLAKPADPTPIIASIGVRLLHQAGVPTDVLQLVVGSGSIVGAKLTSDPRIKGVCFTGSTAVAQTINKTMAENLEASSVLIAETGGINAMIVDSTALPQQAVNDIVNSAFQSAGQRCSALRLLYVQKDIEDEFLAMLYGAMDELQVANPWGLSTDLGPVITKTAQKEICSHIEKAALNGKLLKQLAAPEGGIFIGPSIIKVAGINDLDKEIFGPVLHVATFESDEIDQIIEDINDSGYGLTFGLHTRIDERVEKITTSLNVGNIYINRNQIGAIVGSQPFGGEGLSGTGPKAGGAHYVKRFCRESAVNHPMVSGGCVAENVVQSEINSTGRPERKILQTLDLPGPTGESNRLSYYPRGLILCLGPTIEDANQQARMAQSRGCSTLIIVPNSTGANMIDGFLERSALKNLQGFDGVALWSESADLVETQMALSNRDSAIIPLFSTHNFEDLCIIERHVCIDTTAAGGNASLLAEQ